MRTQAVELRDRKKVGSPGAGGEQVDTVFDGHELQFGERKTFWRWVVVTDAGKVLTPPNCKLKNGWNGKPDVVCVSPRWKHTQPVYLPVNAHRMAPVLSSLSGAGRRKDGSSSESVTRSPVKTS